MKIDPGLLKVPFGHKIIINQWALTSFCNHAPISKICPLGGLFFEKIIVINKFIVVQYQKLFLETPFFWSKIQILNKFFSEFFMIFGFYSNMKVWLQILKQFLILQYHPQFWVHTTIRKLSCPLVWK